MKKNLSSIYIKIPRQDATYPIIIGQGLFTNTEILAPFIQGSQVLIVTQENVSRHYLPLIQKALQHYQCDIHCLPNGEQNKTVTEWQSIITRLADDQHERQTTLIAFGGGVAGDMTGFAAACYMRGVNYIQIPTTLIAQVDAAIGGKTAVNLPQGKNLLGAFHQPRAVLIDIDFLQSLPQREYMAGLAEVIKYALICDKDFFIWLEKNIHALIERDENALLHAIETSVAIKANIIMQDEKETGMRSLLNFGHTFGHALETFNSYQKLLHGEAVAVGMWLAGKLSVELNYLSQEDNKRILDLLKILGIQKFHFDFPSPEKFIALMRHDKKVARGSINFIVLKEIGHAVKTAAVSAEQIIAVLEKDKITA
jgi:3-dehydroquinate synthase